MTDLSPLDRHTNIGLMFSGGKDSLACVYLLREHLHRITLLHNDTGDLLPETRAVVEHVKTIAPHFVHLRGDVHAWIAVNGLPTDLLPHSAHPIGRAMHESSGPPLVARYDCCWSNLMRPIYDLALERGVTLIIRGTKAVDMTRLPVRDGQVEAGIEFFYPIEGWTNEQVFSYLRLNDAPISRIYDYVDNSPECARCSAWWGEKRAAYLRKYHPHLWNDYGVRLRAVTDAIDPPLANLRREVAEFNIAPNVSKGGSA